ncbi:methyltransferase [Pseudogulbenkiania ferrooxidans]|uniref:Methyltransferase type 12 domain-containing protein n=1 Tax=Pseudogulbenkiania ferrooxidans EGD-HP2 TaxID=1388764 RepID=A0ABN0N6Y2_9NEIS|nr:methyltransferase [Pseudogulbenkiania ferrooxidans]ERE07005.1 hypothetical protein O166_07745 [Pseudogulbenkiania ferrooxidans EGD-HP2]
MTVEDERLLRAQRLHLSGDAEAAESAYRDLLDDEAQGAAARHWLGFLLMQRDRAGEALPLLERAVAADGGHAEWHFNLGLARARMGLDQEAVSALSEAVRLDPPRYFYWTNLGAQLMRAGRDAEAEQALCHAVSLNQHCPDAFHLLTGMLLRLGRHGEARRCNALGVLAEPPGAMAPIAVGQALCELGRHEEARALAQDWLRERGDSPVARHMLAAFGGGEAPDSCDAEYVGSAFDAAAASFDQDLARLRYQGPQWTAACLSRLGIAAHSLPALDLGCGTGLVGEAALPYASRLDGVDLSAGMLEQARAKGIYDSLDERELRGFLRTGGGTYQLIVCMDTLPYLGELEELFILLAARAMPGCLLLFCTESLDDGEAGDFRLHHSGRYRHHARYLDRLLQEGWEVLERTRMPVRDESGCPVWGDFVCARKR